MKNAADLVVGSKNKEAKITGLFSTRNSREIFSGWKWFPMASRATWTLSSTRDMDQWMGTWI